MGLHTQWRDALVTSLTATFDGAEVKPGERSGVSRDMPRINVFAGGWGKDSARVVVANPMMIIRYWPKRSKQPPPTTPHDPAELDDARDQLLAALRPLQASLNVPDLWYFLVDSADTDPDPDEWGVEVRLKGFGKNIAAIA